MSIFQENQRSHAIALTHLPGDPLDLRENPGEVRDRPRVGRANLRGGRGSHCRPSDPGADKLVKCAVGHSGAGLTGLLARPGEAPKSPPARH